MTQDAGLPNRMEALKAMPDGWRKRLQFMAILTEALERRGLRPVVVGGHAVEFYTLGGYATADMDIVISDAAILDESLKSFGFAREGRHWYSTELDIAIESPASVLAGDVQRISEVEVNGLRVYIIGIEDIIIDRLNAFVHWRSERDGEWAKEMFAMHRNEIEMAYLNRRAVDEHVEDALDAMRSELD